MVQNRQVPVALAFSTHASFFSDSFTHSHAFQHAQLRFGCCTPIPDIGSSGPTGLLEHIAEPLQISHEKTDRLELRMCQVGNTLGLDTACSNLYERLSSTATHVVGFGDTDLED